MNISNFKLQILDHLHTTVWTMLNNIVKESFDLTCTYDPRRNFADQPILFWELKSRYCIGLTVRQSSSVLWIEKQLWCCDAAVSACAVQLQINQTKYSGTNKTQQNKCRWGESFNASLRVSLWSHEEMTFDKSGQQTSLNVRVMVQVLYRWMSLFH